MSRLVYCLYVTQLAPREDPDLTVGWWVRIGLYRTPAPSHETELTRDLENAGLPRPYALALARTMIALGLTVLEGIISPVDNMFTLHKLMNKTSLRECRYITYGDAEIIACEDKTIDGKYMVLVKVYSETFIGKGW